MCLAIENRRRRYCNISDTSTFSRFTDLTVSLPFRIHDHRSDLLKIPYIFAGGRSCKYQGKVLILEGICREVRMKTWTHPGGKLIELGPSSLTDEELLAILIGSGYKGRTAQNIAKDLLENYYSISGLMGKK